MAYIYMTQHYPGDFVSLPIYKIKGHSIYRTHHHPGGYMAVAVMEIRSNLIYMTRQYPAKYKSAAIYEINNTSVHMTQDHPATYTASEVMVIKRSVSSKPLMSIVLIADSGIEYPKAELEELNVAVDRGFGDIQC